MDVTTIPTISQIDARLAAIREEVEALRRLRRLVVSADQAKEARDRVPGLEGRADVR